MCVFLIASSDIIHSFGIVGMGLKIDAISGRINLVYELVRLNGKIKGFCYELCGQYHSSMVVIGLVFTCYRKRLINYYVLFYFMWFL